MRGYIGDAAHALRFKQDAKLGCCVARVCRALHRMVAVRDDREESHLLPASPAFWSSPFSAVVSSLSSQQDSTRTVPPAAGDGRSGESLTSYLR